MIERIRTEEEQLAYFEQCHEKFVQAAESSGYYRHYFRVAGSSICIVFAGHKMEHIMLPAFEHLRINETETADLTLCVWDSESTGIKMVPHPCEHHSFTDRGDIWGFFSNRIKTAFHYSDFSVNVLDLQRGTGIYWVESAGNFRYWVYASPLRTLIHWWMESLGFQLIHAAAIGTENGALLIVGKGGAGKSTTALSCLRVGFYYLGDDYIILKMDPEPTVFSLYSSAKLNFADVEKFPGFHDLVLNRPEMTDDKAVIHLYPEFKNQIVKEMPVRAIITTEITNREKGDFIPAGFWTIQQAVSFTTLSHLPYPGKSTYNFFSLLANSLPKHILRPGRNLTELPLLVSECIDNSVKNKMTVSKTDVSDTPLVSVIIPVYNGAEFIREVIENIYSQNYPAVEILVINDGSTDDTDAVVREMNRDIRYFWYGNDGPSYARNRGIRDASGEFISFLDVDDLWPEGNLRLLVNEFLKDPEAEVVRGYGQLMKKNPETGEYYPEGDPKESFPAYIGAALYRREVFRKVGLFDAEMEFGEDSDWYIRAVELDVRMKWVDRVTLLVRRHGKNMTEGKDLVQLYTLRVFKKAVDRMRLREKGMLK